MNVVFALSGCIYLLAILIPDHYRPWGSFYNEYLAFLAFALLLVTGFNVQKKVNIVLLVLMGCLFGIVLQVVTNKYYFYSDAVMAGAYLLAFAMVYQFGISTGSKEKVVHFISIVLATSALLSAFIGIAQWLDLRVPMVVSIEDARYSGNLAQANNYATLLFLGLVAFQYHYVKNNIGVWVFLLVSIILSWGMMASGSRTSLLQILFSFVWVACFWRRDSELKIKRLSCLPLLCYFFACGALPFVNHFLLIDSENLSSGARLVGGPYSNRVNIWLSILHGLRYTDWLGYGWGQVSVAQFSHLESFDSQVLYVEHSHNIVLDILVWCGPILGLLVILLSISQLIRYVLTCKSLENWFLTASIVGLVIHALLEFPLEYSYFLLPFALMIGLLDAQAFRTCNVPINSKIFTSTCLIAYCLFMIFIWMEYRIIEEDSRLMRAQNFGLQVNMEERLSTDVILMNGPRDFILFARTPSYPGMTESKLEWMRKVTYRYPLAVAIFRYSVALGLNGYAEGAQKELAKIKILYGEDLYLYYLKHWALSIKNGKEM